MADHLLKLLICVLGILITQVHCNGNDAFVNITLLGSAAKGGADLTGAVCLDGSPAGYHYSKGSGEGANNWLVYLPGGGWCASKSECVARAGTKLGSTKNVTNTFFGGILSPDQTINPDFYSWNRVVIRYCDGSSFSGDVEEVDPETKLHLRGSKIFGAVVDELLGKGLKNAKNAILAGNSAGGLATMLNCDRFRALLPPDSRVKCISDSGFFLDGKNLPGSEDREKYFTNVVVFHDMIKSLPPACTSRKVDPLCIFPENMAGEIKTPLFLLNSAFDEYQVKFNLKPGPAEQLGWQNCTNNMKDCTPAQLQLIKDFRATFLEKVKELGDSPSRGLFINSCYVHDFIYSGERWSWKGSLGDKTIAKAIGDWYFDRSVVQLIDTQHDNPLNCTVA